MCTNVKRRKHVQMYVHIMDIYIYVYAYAIWFYIRTCSYVVLQCMFSVPAHKLESVLSTCGAFRAKQLQCLIHVC